MAENFVGLSHLTTVKVVPPFICVSSRRPALARILVQFPFGACLEVIFAVSDLPPNIDFDIVFAFQLKDRKYPVLRSAFFSSMFCSSIPYVVPQFKDPFDIPPHICLTIINYNKVYNKH